MYAVIRTGGKQYRVSENDVIRVERLSGSVGERLILDDVLLIGGSGSCVTGSPALDKARVCVEVLEQTRGDKIRVFKKKRRKGYRRTLGHRQYLTVLRIDELQPEGKSEKKRTVSDKPASKETPSAKKTETVRKSKESVTKEAPKRTASPRSDQTPAKTVAASKAKTSPKVKEGSKIKPPAQSKASAKAKASSKSGSSKSASKASPSKKADTRKNKKD